LKQAAAQRLESVRRPQTQRLSEIERVLLCALVLPDADSARALAAGRLAEHPDWYADLPCAALIESLASGPAPDNPMDATASDEERTMLALALQSPVDETTSVVPLATQVEHTLQTLEQRRRERRLRELRTMIAEASRRADDAMVMQLAAEKLELERALRG
jgi:DNA primase